MTIGERLFHWSWLALVCAIGAMVLFVVWAGLAAAGKLVEPTTLVDGGALTGLRDCEYVAIANENDTPDWTQATKIPASSPAGGGTTQFPTDGQWYAARCTRVSAGGEVATSTVVTKRFPATLPAAPTLSD